MEKNNCTRNTFLCSEQLHKNCAKFGALLLLNGFPDSFFPTCLNTAFTSLEEQKFKVEIPFVHA